MRREPGHHGSARLLVLTHDTHATFGVEHVTAPGVFEDACRSCMTSMSRAAPSSTRIGFHHSLPTTRVWVARDAGRVNATIALVPDSVHGLPCDALHPWELGRMRARGEWIAEIAVRRGQRRAGRRAAA